MRKSVILCLSIFLLSACSGSKNVQGSGGADNSSGHTRTKEVEFLDDNTYKLVVTTDDRTYGYDKLNPVKVGGASEMSGPSNERKFLNGLAGPNGETIGYYRMGSCCAFKTPNGIGNVGLLDRYKVYWQGAKDTAILFINMYDKGDLKIPVGFQAKKITRSI
jgi:hypothetical protein